MIPNGGMCNLNAKGFTVILELSLSPLAPLSSSSFVFMPCFLIWIIGVIMDSMVIRTRRGSRIIRVIRVVRVDRLIVH